MTNSVTNERLSSAMFVLSQSDREGNLTTSQHFINVNDAGANDPDRHLYLQWSLTQSGGLESLESESQYRGKQLLQQFNSTASFDPTSNCVKSEDYQSQFNSVTLIANADTQRLGEHLKPIMVNSMPHLVADL